MPIVRKSNLFVSSLGLAVFIAAGCTYEGDNKANATTRPADRALRDPFGKWTTVNTDISGGGTSNLNRDAWKRDIDNFLLK